VSCFLFDYRAASLENKPPGGFLGFYIDDLKFEGVWADAVRFVEELRGHKWDGVIAPDFSVWRDDPAATQVWNVYRSRWCARYWQEVGIKVIPSLNWSDSRSYDFAFDGLPVGAPVLSCQCRTTRSRAGKEHFLRGIAEGIKRLRPETIVVYGGAENQTWLEANVPKGVNWVWLQSRTNAVHKRRRKERKDYRGDAEESARHEMAARPI
jgi:hypothetical protein